MKKLLALFWAVSVMLAATVTAFAGTNPGHIKKEGLEQLPSGAKIFLLISDNKLSNLSSYTKLSSLGLSPEGLDLLGSYDAALATASAPGGGFNVIQGDSHTYLSSHISGALIVLRDGKFYLLDVQQQSVGNGGPKASDPAGLYLGNEGGGALNMWIHLFRDTSLLPETPPKPGEDENKPGEGDNKPGEDENKPGEGESKPGEGENKPGEGESKPGEDENKPGEGENKPGEDESKPGDGENKPGEGENKPGEGESKPGEDENKPDEGESKPGEGENKPGVPGHRPDKVEVVEYEGNKPKGENSTIDGPALPLGNDTKTASLESVVILDPTLPLGNLPTTGGHGLSLTISGTVLLLAGMALAIKNKQ